MAVVVQDAEAAFGGRGGDQVVGGGQAAAAAQVARGRERGSAGAGCDGRLRQRVEGGGEGGVLVLVAGGGEQLERDDGAGGDQAGLKGRFPARSNAGSRCLTQADVSTTSGTVANGSAKVGFALGVDLARPFEVVVGFAAGDAQEVVHGRSLAFAFVALDLGAADGEIADQA